MERCGGNAALKKNNQKTTQKNPQKPKKNYTKLPPHPSLSTEREVLI